ncbi:MAG: hypothetical protein DMG13_34760, partial [Acidobacteria bacterium]
LALAQRRGCKGGQFGGIRRRKLLRGARSVDGWGCRAVSEPPFLIVSTNKFSICLRSTSRFRRNEFMLCEA